MDALRQARYSIRGVMSCSLAAFGLMSRKAYPRNVNDGKLALLGQEAQPVIDYDWDIRLQSPNVLGNDHQWAFMQRLETTFAL